MVLSARGALAEAPTSAEPHLDAAARAEADGLLAEGFTCLGTGAQNYSPGLTLEPRPTVITAAATFPVCIGGPVTSATFSFGPFTALTSCLLSTPVGTSEIDYTWDDGSTSHFVGTYVVTTPLGQLVVTSTGSFTSGRFAGQLVQSTNIYTAPNPLACLTTGVSAISGPANVVVFPL